MGIIDKYKTRLTVKGDTERERLLNYEKRDLLINTPKTLSCKDVLINGIERKLIIDSGTKPYYKQICSLPNETFNAGEYVIYENSPWLIINADWDNEVYTDGNMYQCNFEIKWQDESNGIISRQAVILSASQYNMGEESSKTLTVGYNQLMIYIPLDEDTVKLKSDKRFFIDNNKINPKPYRLTRVDTVTMVYQGIGCVLLVVTEDQYNPDTDNIELMLCDYQSPQQEITTNITYNGEPKIRIGRSKTFKSDSPTTFSLVVSDIAKDMLHLTQTDDYSCKVSVDNKPILVGASFKLVAGNQEILIEIQGGV